jgi:hypothetical protein
MITVIPITDTEGERIQDNKIILRKYDEIKDFVENQITNDCISAGGCDVEAGKINKGGYYRNALHSIDNSADWKTKNIIEYFVAVNFDGTPWYVVKKKEISLVDCHEFESKPFRFYTYQYYVDEVDDDTNVLMVYPKPYGGLTHEVITTYAHDTDDNATIDYVAPNVIMYQGYADDDENDTCVWAYLINIDHPDNKDMRYSVFYEDKGNGFDVEWELSEDKKYITLKKVSDERDYDDWEHEYKLEDIKIRISDMKRVDNKED